MPRALLAAFRSHCYRSAAVFAISGGLLAAGTHGLAAAPNQPKPETVAVSVNHAKVIKLPEKAQTVIVGNPAIADLSVQKNGLVVLTGKSFGVTNMMALDASGSLLAESLISVSAAPDAVLTVQRGMDRESYSCAPACQPTIRLGDSMKHFGEVDAQTKIYNTTATNK